MYVVALFNGNALVWSIDGTHERKTFVLDQNKKRVLAFIRVYSRLKTEKEKYSWDEFTNKLLKLTNIKNTKWNTLS